MDGRAPDRRQKKRRRLRKNITRESTKEGKAHRGPVLGKGGHEGHILGSAHGGYNAEKKKHKEKFSDLKPFGEKVEAPDGGLSS